MKLKSIILTTLSIFICFTPAFAQEEENIDFSVISDEAFEEVEQVQLPEAFNPVFFDNDEVVFKQSSFRVDRIDPSIAVSYFPGGRGTNMLVVYTPRYGFHTGTNEFGTEAVIVGHTVTSLSGADSAIPEGGIVISGHGSAKNWITQNVTVGSKVYIDSINDKITVYTTSESYIYDAETKIKEAESIINYYKSSMPSYNDNAPSAHIKSAENYLSMAKNAKKNSSVIKQYTQAAIDEANNAVITALPYVKNELKGVWLRPTELNEEQIISTLDNLKSNGFNNIFLETYFHGKTIFPSKTMNKYGFTVQNETFDGFDPLAVWIKEAHNRGIKVHVWFQSFYVGNQPPEINPSSILSVHPEWGNKTKQFANYPGASRSASEHNGYFLDPANEEVQAFLEELVTEIVQDYHPDGINLDYIRYPNANSRNDLAAWGFSEYARNEFNEMYGVDPVDLTISDAAWYDWNEYRRSKITKFVKRIGEVARNYNVYSSAVIFPDIASALATKQQDWRSWSFQNYIDGFTPLFMTYDSKMLSSMMNDVMRIKSSSTELYAGLFVTFMGGNSEDLIRQIYEARKLHANGVILFDYAHTTPVYMATLNAGAFKSNENDQLNLRMAQKKSPKFGKKKKDKKPKDKKGKKTKVEEKQS
ncbi:family 10 glycosylhydrolase [bacterium]|nr:family 10 glycosylhydrolase [bacterium]